MLRLDSQHDEFLRQLGRVLQRLIDISIHTLDEAFNDSAPMGMIDGQFLIHIAAEQELPRADIARNFLGSQNLGQRAFGAAAEQLELKQAVARRVITLRKEQVVLVLGIDMRDAPAIFQDLHWLRQSGRQKFFFGGQCGMSGERHHYTRKACGNNRLEDGHVVFPAPFYMGKCPTKPSVFQAGVQAPKVSLL